MKANKLAVTRMVYLRAVILMLLLPAFACKKNNAPPAPAVSFQQMAAALEGEVLNGSITTETGDDGLALWCNGGKVLIGIGKIVSTAFTDPGNIEYARVIYSNFGVIVQDTRTNKTWYYIQNDAQSRQRFERLQTADQTTIVSATNGTIRWNIS